ncbi:TPA: hypothetical protein ACQYC6_002271 [Vibrio parahaemolyticus]
MCGGSTPEVQAPPPPAPPPVPTQDIDTQGIQKKNKAQQKQAQRRGSTSSRRDLKINTSAPGSGLNAGG